MYLTQGNGAVWKSWPDFSSWNPEELADSRPASESSRTCHPVFKINRLEKHWAANQAVLKSKELTS